MNTERTTHTTIAGVAAALLSVLAALASAAPPSYNLDWFSIDSGGGSSTGGVFAVTGTVGQPDAGRMSGGSFALNGGFWGLIAVTPTPGAPPLSITLSNGAVTVAWPRSVEGCSLEWTATLEGNPLSWQTVPSSQYQTNATAISVTIALPVGQRFYRLRQPLGS